jgi:hypothetical protein
MSHDSLAQIPAPCIIDDGLIIDKQDMKRVLHTQDGRTISEGEGCVLEVFADPRRATMVANHALYLNVYSFDYLQLSKAKDESRFDLIQDDRQLRLIPLSNPLQEQANRGINVAELEVMVAEVLSASLDVQIDDEENFPL